MMNEIFSCDVLVIGAGPAGSTTAKFAARAGARVILIERRKQVGVPVQCAEYVPWQMMQEVELPESVIAQRIDSMRTHLPDGVVVETPAKGFIIHRQLFDQYLAKMAVEVGVEIWLQTKAVGYENGLVQIRKGEQGLQIKARVIIGADGPHSMVGKWMGQSNTEFIQTAQYLMPLINEISFTQIYFRQDIPCGYGWVFPKGKIANVGVGVEPQFGITPVEALNSFVKYLCSQKVIEPKRMGVTGGAIPVGGLLPKLCGGNMLLTGDAAGMAHPITGAGVSNAVLCGRLAGEIAGQSVLSNNLAILSDYEVECQLLLGEPLRKAWQKRKALQTHWNGNDEERGKAIRSSWIAFEEYYQ